MYFPFIIHEKDRKSKGILSFFENTMLMEINALKRQAYAQGRTLAHHRRRLHAFAECGFHLPKTISYVKNCLQFMGYEPRMIGKGGIVCSLKANRADAPTVLLRADMDALPLREETHLSFRAENGNAHACGHDMHTAMLLGAAALLREHRNALPRHVRFFFQGAEEILCGARDGVASGVLDGIAHAFMLHCATAIPYPTGTVLLPRAGVGAPASVFFEVELWGEHAHAGMKGKKGDALLAGASLLCEAAAFAERDGEILFSAGKMAGGDAPNVVAAHVLLSGTFRAYKEEKTEAMRTRLYRLASAARELFGVRVAVRFTGSCPPLRNDGDSLSAFTAGLKEAGIPFVSPDGRSFAAEDFAVIAERAPSLAVAVAAGQRGHGYEHPLHHPRVLFDEDALPVGAFLYALSALSPIITSTPFA